MKYSLVTGVLFIVLICSSCDLFEARNPEKPTQTRSSYSPAVTPDILFLNLKSSFKDRDLKNYMSCFVDTAFTKKKPLFSASAEAISQFPKLSEWDLSSEEQYFRKLASANTSLSLSLTNETKMLAPDSALYNYDYTIGTAEGGTYSGSVQFKILLDQKNTWVISEWRDFSKSGQRCWSILKGLNY